MQPVLNIPALSRLATRATTFANLHVKRLGHLMGQSKRQLARFEGACRHRDPVPLEYSIEWLTCAVASRFDAVMVASKYDTSNRRKPGQPPTVPQHRPPCRPADEGESAVGIPPDTRRSDAGMD